MQKSKLQFKIQKDQKRVIPIVIGSSSGHPRESEDLDSHLHENDVLLDQVENDKRLDIILSGENASVEIIGLVIGKGVENKSLELYVTHAAPRTKSEVKVKSVLRGKSTFAFRGNVKIEKGAKGADAYLRSDALLFDDAKMGDDTPSLEILEPDVKAGHAATIGKVDALMLFYLMSRGLSKTQAEKLLVHGFIKPIVEKIKNRPSFA